MLTAMELVVKLLTAIIQLGIPEQICVQAKKHIDTRTHIERKDDYKFRRDKKQIRACFICYI